MGTSMQKVGSEIGSGNGVLDEINGNSGSLGNFMHQAGTSAAAGFMSQAAKGKFSKDNKDYDRDAQIKAAQVMANDGLVKSVQTAKGLVDSMAFDSSGNVGKKSEFDEYAKGTSNQSRIAANKVMGAGKEDLTNDDMADVKRTEQANVKALIAKGDSLQKSFGNNLDGKLNGQTYDAMIRAQEMGNFSASTQAIKTAGGESAFVALQKASSSMKTAQSMTSVAANETAGFLDANGNMTSKGMEAFAITPGEQASALIGKLNLGAKAKDIVKEAGDKAFDLEMSISGDKFKANMAANKAMAPFFDSKGNILEGQDFWNKQSELKAGSFSGSNSMMFGGGHIFSGGLSQDGSLSGVLSSGFAGKFDDQLKLSTGKKLDAGVEGSINDTLKKQEAAERANYAMNPKKWIEGIAAKGHDAGVGGFMKLGFSQEEAEEMYSMVASPATGVAGAVAIAEVGHRIAGKGSLVGKVWNALPNPFDKTSKNSEGPASYSDNPESDSKVNNKGDHGNPPNSDKDSVSKNTKSSKSGGGSFRKQAGLFIGSSLFGYAATTEANETPTSQGQAEELLKTSSDLVSNAELTVGAGTMAAVGTSKIGLGGAAAAKLGARVTPGLGIAYGAVDGAYRTSQGDYLGAAMSGAIGAASTVPVFGTALAVGGTFAQMATDAFGITGGSNQPPAPQHKGFTTLPMGHNTLGAMEQHFTATQQQNAQAMSNISPTSRYVGFSATDADGNQVNFSTSKSSQSISCGQGLKKR